MLDLFIKFLSYLSGGFYISTQGDLQKLYQ